MSLQMISRPKRENVEPYKQVRQVSLLLYKSEVRFLKCKIIYNEETLGHQALSIKAKRKRRR